MNKHLDLKYLYPESEPAPLHVNVIAAMNKRFEEIDHHPSPAMWNDLETTAQYLERMADGKLEPKFYLNALPAGVGKTTLVIEFVKHLIRSEDHRDIGILICVPLLEEIEALIQDIWLAKSDVAVVTGDEEFNKMGSTDANSARVLLTTQQLVERRLQNKINFADLDIFWFDGKPRQVKIWDEALMPWEELTLGVDAITRSASLIRGKNTDLADALVGLAGEIVKLSNGDQYEVLDIETVFEETYDDVHRYLFGGERKLGEEHDRRTAYVLWRLAGKQVRVRHDPAGNKILDWRDQFPEDFAPIVIFDASGRVRI